MWVYIIKRGNKVEILRIILPVFLICVLAVYVVCSAKKKRDINLTKIKKKMKIICLKVWPLACV